MPRVRRVLSVFIAAVITSSALVSIAAAPAQAGNKGEFITRTEQLRLGDYIQSNVHPNGSIVRLTMQGDGNLVLRNISTNHACWHSGTRGMGGVRVKYQQDGNFVMYNAANDPVWSSGTRGEPGGTVNINPQGRVYVGYTPISPSCKS